VGLVRSDPTSSPGRSLKPGPPRDGRRWQQARAVDIYRGSCTRPDSSSPLALNANRVQPGGKEALSKPQGYRGLRTRFSPFADETNLGFMLSKLGRGERRWLGRPSI
jgi:hypothetical protein